MQGIKRIFLALLMLLPSVGFFACSSDKAPAKAASKGSSSEIVVVAENNLWKTSLGDTIRNYFSSFRAGLPQPEPLYTLVQINLSEFGRLFETHRNILAIAIDSSLTKEKVEIGYDVWAAPQRVVKITAPSIEMLKATFKAKQKEIFNLYENAEIKRLQNLYSKSHNIKSIEAVSKKFHISLNIPADYYLAVNKDNFIWLRREATTMSQGILIYSYPFTDTLAYNPRKIQSVRNQFTRLYVPGPSDSSYMIISNHEIKPVTRTLSLKNQYAVETRGLWETDGDFMGGPFINYTFVDKKNNMVIALDGFVYAPNVDKAQFLKEVQAILLSFEFIDK